MFHLGTYANKARQLQEVPRQLAGLGSCKSSSKKTQASSQIFTTENASPLPLHPAFSSTPYLDALT